MEGLQKTGQIKGWTENSIKEESIKLEQMGAVGEEFDVGF